MDVARSRSGDMQQTMSAWRFEDDEEPADKPFDSKDIFVKIEEHIELHFLKSQLLPPAVRAALDWSCSPQNEWRMRWDVLVLALVIYSCLLVPYNVAFKPLMGADLTDFIVTAVFYADIILNFFTGYDVGYQIVMDKTQIILHYLRGWFFVDLAATIDWEWFGSVVEGLVAPDEADAEEGTPIFIKMLALIKLLRLLRASRLIDNLSANWTTDSGFVDAGKFFMYVIIVAHMLACFFFLSPVIIATGPECLEDADTSASVRCERRAVILICEPHLSSCLVLRRDCIGDPECDTRLDGQGWYYKDQCMQGSWRQQQGLEEICLPGLCSPGAFDLEQQAFDPEQQIELAFDVHTYEFLDTCPDGTEPIPLSENQTVALLTRCLDTAEQGLLRGTDGYAHCPTCNRPARRYIDALYWSLTTMTTIGYGDRGPKTENELMYTLAAEVLGLAYFALLLTQIDRVKIIMGRTKQAEKDLKDGVLQFLKARRLPEELITETIRFINFRYRKNTFAQNSRLFQKEMFFAQQLSTLGECVHG